MYVVEESKASDFEFSIGDVSYSVPRRESLPVPVFRKIRKRIAQVENQEEEAIDAMFDLFDEFAQGALDNLTYEQAMGLIKAYMADDDGDLGESSPSSN